MMQELRPYQARALDQARDAYRAGKRSILLVAPTGAGKTRMGVEIASGALAKGGSVLWLAHREELLIQARTRLLAEGVPRVGIIAAGQPVINAPIQVASIQTLAARASRGLPPGTVVVFDEAHHYAADGWSNVAAAYKDSVRLGLTATPERGDGRALGDLFDHIIEVSSVAELQRMGVLVPCITYAPAGRTKHLSQDPVAAYLARTPGERAFVFVLRVADAERLAAEFVAQGVTAATIHGDTPWELRQARLEAFRLQSRMPLLNAGTTERAPLVLVNVYTLTEGVDVPEASSCILARGCGHEGMFLQMVGRVLRAAPGKGRATLIDLCGVVHKLGLPEAERVWSLEGKAIQLKDKTRENKPKACPACEAMVASWTVDKDGWRCCPICRERVKAPEPVKVNKRALHTMGAAAPPEAKRSALFALAHTAAKRGFKPAWASVQYKTRFGSWPSRLDAAQAERAAIDALGADVVEQARIDREAARTERERAEQDGASRHTSPRDVARVLDTREALEEPDDDPADVADEARTNYEAAIAEMLNCG